MPSVSVIILAWNSGDFLRAAVDALIAQTMTDWQLVLVDNGSTDGSVDRLLTERHDPRIHLLRHPQNLGIGAGTQSALALCRAPWIAIMDSDDCSHPMRLELQLRAAAADPTLDVIGTAAHVTDPAGNITGRYPMFYDPEDIRRYAPFHMPVLHGTLLVRAEVFQAVPYRAVAEIVADYDWLIRVTEQFSVGVLSLPLYDYRVHGGCTTVKRQMESFARVAAVRLTVARRRAGQPENFAAIMEDARRLAADAHLKVESGATTDRHAKAKLFREFSRRCSAEGFPLLAALHAALAVRECATPGTLLCYVRYLVAAARAEPGGWRLALGGLAKGPFWLLLKKAGFPAFPRY